MCVCGLARYISQVHKWDCAKSRYDTHLALKETRIFNLDLAPIPVTALGFELRVSFSNLRDSRNKPGSGIHTTNQVYYEQPWCFPALNYH